MTSSSPGSELQPFPDPRRIALAAGPAGCGGGLSLALHEAGRARAGRPALVLCHGFPELAYSWRHQLPALAAAGFQVLAPDQRGYGRSDAPVAVEAYGLEQLAGDLVALLDARQIERAIFVGHDWGGFVAWAMPLLHPQRTAGVVGVNTPYMAFPTTRVLGQLFPDPERLYILWFQTPGVAEAVLERNPRLIFEKLMRRPAGDPAQALGDAARDANPFLRIEQLDPRGAPLLAPAELDYYASAFARSGFAGAIHWYRNIDANAERVPGLGVDPLDLPCLMITAEWDAALPPRLAEGMSARCRDLEVHGIRSCGHWTQQDRPAELNQLLLDWLTRRF